MTKTLFFGIIPAVFVVLGGVLVLRKGPERTSGRRFLFYLLFIGVLLMPVVLVIEQISPEHDTRLSNQISILTAPIVIGVLALILINLKLLAGLKTGEKILAAFLGLTMLALMAGSVWGQTSGMAQMILSSTLVLAFIWVFVGRFDALGVVLSFAALIVLVLFNVGYLDDLSLFSKWLRNLIGLSLFVLPALVVTLAAVWITSSLKTIQHRKEIQKTGKNTAICFSIMLRFGLAVILLGYLAYTTMWASIWDQTSDGLGGVMFLMWGSLAAIAAGMLISLSTIQGRKSAGLIFALLVPVLLFGAFIHGWSISYHTITETRATRIQLAIESFYRENDRYPEDLRELIPNYLLWIPVPVILRGEGWCYQGSQDFYRLGAFFREYFSTPLSVHIYASAGLPDANWECDERLAGMKARYDLPYFFENETIRPTPEPLPTSDVSIQRIPLQPLLSGRLITPGGWSPDGTFLFFNQLKTNDQQLEMILNFLNVETGEICQVESGYPADSLNRKNHVWLTDERLLFINREGGIDLLKPCEADTEHLTNRYPVQFSQVAAYDHKRSRVLLKTNDSFWIMDGINLDVWPIPEVTPNPYELHWDQFSWSPNGERLAISRLNGRDREAGSTLYLVEGDTGKVSRIQSLEYASDQSAPWIEWLTNDELLIHGDGVLATMDYRSNPPRATFVMKDTFNLDLAYPEDLSSMDYIVNPTGESYHIAIRTNTSENQAVHLYHSETGNVDIYHPFANLLLFFPEGKWMQLPNIMTDVPEHDEFELFWINSNQKESRRLIVEGHIPRNYPILFTKYLPQSSMLAFSSSQGISLVSISSGETLNFWDVSNKRGVRDIDLQVSPNEEALIAIVDAVELYFIALQP